MRIGVPKELTVHDSRVGMVPAGARERAPAPPPETAAAAASYREKWDAALDRYARAPGGAFGMENLGPAPRPELWQDAPQSPLSLLTSPQAQGRIAVCQLISGMEESRVNVGVATNASATGDVTFRRPRAISPPWRRTADLGTLPGRTRGDGVETRARRPRGAREFSCGEG